MAQPCQPRTSLPLNRAVKPFGMVPGASSAAVLAGVRRNAVKTATRERVRVRMVGYSGGSSPARRKTLGRSRRRCRMPCPQPTRPPCRRPVSARTGFLAPAPVASGGTVSICRLASLLEGPRGGREGGVSVLHSNLHRNYTHLSITTQAFAERSFRQRTAQRHTA